MALTKLIANLNIIQALVNRIRGQGTTVKAKLDEGPNTIKTYINDTLTVEIEAQFATKSELSGIVLGQIPDDTLTDAKLKQTGDNILPNFDAHLLETPADEVHGLDATIAKFKTGTGTFTDNDTAQTFTDAFCTAASLVVVSITSVTVPQGTWSVEAADGSFTITSTVAESADITFDYYIVKVV